MDKELWRNRHLDENFTCPNCKRGILSLKSQEQIQTVKSKEDDLYVLNEGMVACALVQYYSFSAKLECNKCYEIVLCSGSSSESDYYSQQEDDFPNLLELMRPKLFLPTLDIIEIPTKTPKTIEEEIKKSFELYWINESACSNSIRKALEYLMDAENVETESTKKSKTTKLNLHQRLERYTKIKNKELLLAVKYIGNQGSHDEVNIDYVYSFTTLLMFSSFMF